MDRQTARAIIAHSMIPTEGTSYMGGLEDQPILAQSHGSIVIDELTYGTWGGSKPGRSVSFSVDCTWSDRSSWARWSYAANVWTSGFQGTPNADNTGGTLTVTDGQHTANIALLGQYLAAGFHDAGDSGTGTKR